MNLWRELFPIFQHRPEWVYLDSAATAQKPQSVIDALVRYYACDCATVHRAVYSASLSATRQYDEAREAVRRFLNAASCEEIVFTRGTTESIHLISRAFEFQPDDEIVLTESAHHSNLIAWQMIAREKGLTLKYIPVNDDGSLQWPYPISSKTKLVALTHVSNVTGAIAPIRAITQAAHHAGAVVLVDGAQAAPHLPVDVQESDVDFYAFSGHKCYGPTGIGVLYGKKERLQNLPPSQGGGGMADYVDFSKSAYLTPPLRFEAGTPPIAEAIGLKAALAFIESIDREKIFQHEQNLLALAREELSQISGFREVGTAFPKGPILTFSIHRIHPLDLAAVLDSKNIAIRSGHLCAQPLLRKWGYDSVSRASFALYNTEEDVLRFTRAVRDSVSLIRGYQAKPS
jgi:cysteine desulfurase/selenocysteine lyase